MIRPATPHDVPLILQFIRELAEYEKLAHEVCATEEQLLAILDRYPAATQVWWVQEEPANQGAWPTFGLTLPEVCSDTLAGIKRISRRAMSAPSSGSSKVHAVEQQEIIDQSFAP